MEDAADVNEELEMRVEQYNAKVAELLEYKDELEQKSDELQRVTVEKMEMEKELIRAKSLLEGMEKGKEEMMRMLREQSRMTQTKLREIEHQFQVKTREEKERMQVQIQLQEKQWTQLSNKTKQLTEEMQMVRGKEQQAEEEVMVVKKEIDNGKQVAVMKGIERAVDEVQWGDSNNNSNSNQQQSEEEPQSTDPLEWQQINHRIHRKLKHLKQEMAGMRETIMMMQRGQQEEEVQITNEETDDHLSARQRSFKLFLYSALGQARSAVVDRYYNAFVENDVSDCMSLMEIGDTEMNMLTGDCGMNVVHAKQLLRKIKQLVTNYDALKEWIMNIMAANGVFTIAMLTKRISMHKFKSLLNSTLS